LWAVSTDRCNTGLDSRFFGHLLNVETDLNCSIRDSPVGNN
jgi:hypothetical protein